MESRKWNSVGGSSLPGVCAGGSVSCSQFLALTQLFGCHEMSSFLPPCPLGMMFSLNMTQKQQSLPHELKPLKLWSKINLLEEGIKIVDSWWVLEPWIAWFQTITPDFHGSKDRIILLFLPTEILLTQRDT
jgi:hypothetical protein